MRSKTIRFYAALTVAVNLVSVLGFLELAGAKNPQALISLLRSDPSPKVRAQAALALIRFREPEVESSLVAALQDESSLVRGAAARALLTLGRTRRTMSALCQAVRDSASFVRKWAKRAIQAVVHRLDTILFDVSGIQVRDGFDPDALTKHLQEGVLTTLVESERFDLAQSLDFRVDEHTKDAVVGTGSALELTSPKVSVVGDERAASSEARLRASLCLGEVVVFDGSGKGEARATPQASAEDEFRDEYTIDVPGPDARLLAVEAAGRDAARKLKAFLERSRGPSSGR